MFTRYELFATSISALSRYVQKIERDEMERYGLKGGYAQYLLAMSRYPDGVTAVELCEICDKDKGAVSRALGELEEKGLISRSCSSEKRYRAPIKLTQTGMDAANFVNDRATLAVELAGNGLSEDDRHTLYSALNLIASNLKTISKAGIPASEDRPLPDGDRSAK